MNEPELFQSQSRPVPNGYHEWCEFWTKHHNQPWRTEPDIDEERRKFLAEHRAIVPDVEHGIYPFRDIKLSRADVEWLLATHESAGITGPVMWSDESHQERSGLDLRGANLQHIDLHGLPLARLHGGVAGGDSHTTYKQWTYASIRLEGSNLSDTHLEGAQLGAAHLEGVQLKRAKLERAILAVSYMEGADLEGATLDKASMFLAHLEAARLDNASLREADLFTAHLQGASLEGAHMEGANLFEATFAGAVMVPSDLQRIRPWKPDFPETLRPASLMDAYFNESTNLQNPILSDTRGRAPSLADVHWGGADLTAIDWSYVRFLDDEFKAKELHETDIELPQPWRTRTYKSAKLWRYRIAVRAYRQLANALRSQGMNEDADRYAYRAQQLQRIVFRRQRRMIRWSWSWFLEILAGYGYEPIRAVALYVSIIFAFASLYQELSPAVHLRLSFVAALVMSIASFHGRGFFPTPNLPLDSSIAVAGAIEAVFGLVIEASFIATFTQRYFGR